MGNLLRDPIWQFVGALIGIAGIVFSIVVYFLQRNRKSLVFDIISITRVVPPSTRIHSDIQILYKGEVIADVWIAIVSIINDGNSPITVDDYVSPMNIELGSQAMILSCEVIETRPKGIQVKTSSTISRVRL
jgi:hypothetical protein